MAEQLGAHAALADTHRSVPSTHIRRLSLPVTLTPTASSDLYRHLFHVHIHTQRSTHINIIKIIKFLSKKLARSHHRIYAVSMKLLEVMCYIRVM